MKFILPQKQIDVITLKQFWMRVSFRDAVKLGIGFALGVSITSFFAGLFWFLIKLIFIGGMAVSNVPINSIPL